MLMEFIQAFLLIVLFFIGLHILLRLIDRFCPDLIAALLLPLLVDIAIEISNSVSDAINGAAYTYPLWVYNNYKIHRMKKQLGLIWKNEPFVWTDEYEDQLMGEAFRFAIGEKV